MFRKANILPLLLLCLLLLLPASDNHKLRYIWGGCGGFSRLLLYISFLKESSKKYTRVTRKSLHILPTPETPFDTYVSIRCFVFYMPLLLYSAPLLASQHWKIHRKQSVGGSCVSICLYSTLIVFLTPVPVYRGVRLRAGVQNTFLP